MAKGSKLVYIAHPYSDDPEGNIAKALRWVRWASSQPRVVPVAPWIVYVQALDNDNPGERELGMQFNYRVLEVCDEIWLCGPYLSEGMIREEAISTGLSVRVVRYEGDEPPEDF